MEGKDKLLILQETEQYLNSFFRETTIDTVIDMGLELYNMAPIRDAYNNIKNEIKTIQRN